jgi:branched-chain amino acid transport system ATP-binding protein
MLELRDVEAKYGASQVLHGVSLRVDAGEAVGLLGRNGMGKTTTVRSILGLLVPSAGTVTFAGRDTTRLPAHRTARLGIGLVPEGRQIFPNLTVEENLRATERNPFGRPDPWTVGKVYELFPRLAERRTNWGDQLSGGEQQMVAIGRALVTNPKLMILDEATEGLAPQLRADIWRSIRVLREQGQALLVIDTNWRELLGTVERAYLLEKGRVVWSGRAGDLSARPEIATRYLGV